MAPLLKISVKFGTIAGILGTILFIAIYYFGRHPLMISPFLDFRIPIFGIFIFFSLREFRDYEQDGTLHFWQGLIGAMALVVVATTIGSLSLHVFGSFEKDFVSSYISLMTEYLKSFPQHEIDLIGKEIYARNLSALPSTHIGTLTITYFAQGMGIGLFVSIILSVILRKQPKN